MAKYYFYEEEDEICYTHEYILDKIKSDGLTEKIVYKAELERGITDFMYCKIEGDIGEKGWCGKECKDYSPRNGKWGMCNHQGQIYSANEEILIKLNL